MNTFVPIPELYKEAQPVIPYGKQSITEDDIAAVVDVLRSSLITQGPAVAAFETAFARKVDSRHAIAVNNATSALMLALKVAGVGPGDRVVTSPITFLSSANAAALLGATPDFCDIDPLTYTLDPASLEKNWKSDTKAVIAVDYAGHACDLPAIARVTRERGAVLISDACHAVGGSFHTTESDKSWLIGGNPWADFTVFSFHPVKSMTTGEGGMLVTDNKEWADKARSLRTHGMVRDPAHYVVPASDRIMGEKGSWYYEMQDLGWNFRLTDIHAALGLSQLSRLDAFLARRREIVAAYNVAFNGMNWLTTPKLRHQADLHTTSWHLYTLQIDFHAAGRSRTQIVEELAAQGISAHVLYIPVHLQPWYRRTYGYAPGKCPVAEAFYLQALCLPLYPAMSDQDVERVITAVRSVAPRAAVAA
jgi:UDP-4-amino-4,6-dideoxy-N-acetyl-beta-L-altrosamine transaminase